MRRLWFVVLSLVLAGCASTASRDSMPPVPGSWAAVSGLERGIEIVVAIDCAESSVEACTSGRAVSAGHESFRLDATLVEADADSMLVRLRRPGSSVLLVPREIVAAVDVVQDDSTLTGTLIGLAVGLGLCATFGLYGEQDLTAAGKLLFSGICGGGGAALGYAIDRDGGGARPAQRIYQRPGTEPSMRPGRPR